HNTATYDFCSLSLHDALPISHILVFYFMYRYSAFCSTIQGTSCATSVPRTFVSGTSGYILPNLVVYALCELNVCWKRCVARGNEIGRAHVCTPVTWKSSMPSS